MCFSTLKWRSWIFILQETRFSLNHFYNFSTIFVTQIEVQWKVFGSKLSHRENNVSVETRPVKGNFFRTSRQQRVILKFILALAAHSDYTVFVMCNSCPPGELDSFLPTVGAAQSWSQVWPDEEGRQVGRQVEVPLRVGVLGQRQVLHQVIVSVAKHAQVL